jgi:glycosyltransferase involved in cell wall biosynthesis
MPEHTIHVGVLTSVHPPLDTRVFHREAKAARDMGARVTLIAPGAPDHPVDGIAFQSLPSWGGRAGRPFRWPVLWWKAWRLKADVYHFHDPELLPWGLLLHWVTRKPVIYDSHEYLREDISTKHWIPRQIRGPLSRFADWFEKRVAKRLSAVVTVTEDMGERFRAFQPRVAVVRNLPPASARPTADEGERKPDVVYAGLLNAARGLDILYETARVVHEAHPETRFRMIGNVEWHEVDPALQEKTAGEWQAVGVDFVGTVPFEEVAPLLARGSIGWLPRSPHDLNNLLAWPNKLVEYMAAGLPIVASDLPTQAAVIAEAGCGVVVDAISPAAHAAAINELLDNPERARALGSAGREASETKFTWEAEAQKLQALYRELCQLG